MGWIPPRVASLDYRNWETEDPSRWEYLGETHTERPVFFDRQSGSIYHGRAIPENETYEPDVELIDKIEPEETLGTYLEKIGNETGWESLSKFARDHLEDTDQS